MGLIIVNLYFFFINMDSNNVTYSLSYASNRLNPESTFIDKNDTNKKDIYLYYN